VNDGEVLPGADRLAGGEQEDGLVGLHVADAHHDPGPPAARGVRHEGHGAEREPGELDEARADDAALHEAGLVGSDGEQVHMLGCRGQRLERIAPEELARHGDPVIEESSELELRLEERAAGTPGVGIHSCLEPRAVAIGGIVVEDVREHHPRPRRDVAGMNSWAKHRTGSPRRAEQKVPGGHPARPWEAGA
jgi:hypothetical protein